MLSEVRRVDIYKELQRMQTGFCGIKWGGMLIWRSGPNSFVIGLTGSISIAGPGMSLDAATDLIWGQLAADYQLQRNPRINSDIDEDRETNAADKASSKKYGF